MTLIIGLTGGIATGKSTVANYLESKGMLRVDADACVHKLLSEDTQIMASVAELFPDVVTDGAIDRKALGAIVFHHHDVLKQLESILHPKVRAYEDAMIAQGKKDGVAFVLLDIPLLFETDAYLRCDVTLTTDCNPDIQRARALQRPHMTEEKLEAIMARQLPREERNSRADYVIDTSTTWGETQTQIDDIIRKLTP